MVALTRKQIGKKFEPMDDYGFFGPDSVTWKVWSYPTSFVLGFARAVTIEHFDPNLAAAVIQSGGVKYRPSNRYARTLRYFGLVMFADAAKTTRAADVLVKVHSKAIGHDPVTGGEYDANHGDSQLWIHVTAWHSILLCYEKFGPGQLSEHEENQFWAECREAAKLQTIDPEKVPASREEVRRYFEEWRPRLAASEGAQDMIKFILTLKVAVPEDASKWQQMLIAPVLPFMRRAIIATYPKYMRDMAGIRQSRLVDALTVIPMKLGHRLFAISPFLLYWFGRLMAPAAMEIAGQALLGVPPKSDKIWTVREAQEHFGYAIPSEAHHDMRLKQRDRVFEQGIRPSDEGLAESQEAIGRISQGGINVA